MSTSSLPLSQAQGGKLRPLNIIRDLPKIADLVELCFHKNMDKEGKRYVQQMRSAKKNTSWLSWATTSLPLKGFIWEEDKEIVGNISIVPFQHQKEKIILFANVAVHPDHRRRGIARMLTQKALEHVQKIKPASVWVHVEEKNQGAIQLYRSLGFQNRMLRTTWRASTQLPPPQAQSRVVLAKSPTRYWRTEEKSLAVSYPPEMRWYRMPKIEVFAPGLSQWLERVFLEVDLNHWVLADGNRFEASLFWLSRRRYRAPLWLAAAPQTDAATLSAFLLHARSYFAAQNRELVIDYPAGERENAFREAGFSPLRTLLWMRT